MTTTIRLSPNILLQEVGNETVLLDLQGENYFGLDSVGTRIFKILRDTESIEKTLDILHQEFDGFHNVIEQDLRKFVADLIHAGLLSSTEP